MALAVARRPHGVRVLRSRHRVRADTRPDPSPGRVRRPARAAGLRPHPQYVGQQQPQGAAVDCFEAAFAAGAGAELLVEGYGVDSGPVFLYHRALPGGGMETFLDHRRDHYRSSDWQRFLCPEARSLRDTGECADGEP